MTLSLRKMRGVVLALLFVSTMINYVDRQTLSVLLPALRGSLHLSTVQYGSIATAFLAAYTVGQIPAGMWLDRVGTRVGFSVFVAVWSVAAVLQAFAATPIRFGIIRALLGLSEAGNWPAGTKVIATWFPQEQRAVAMAFFDAGSAIGAVVAPPLVAVIALHYGWRQAFIATGLMGFVWLALWLVVYRAPEVNRWLTPEDRGRAMDTTTGTERTTVPVWSALKELAQTSQLWGLMLVRLLATPIWWFYVFWLPDYLSKGRGFTLREIGLYAWIPYLTVDLGKFVGGYASDRLLATGTPALRSRKTVMTCGAALMLSGLFVANSATSALALLWVCMATFGFGIWSANILALHADSFPVSMMGSAVGFTGTAASLGGSIFTFATGMIVARSGYAHVFLMTGLLAVLACAALWGALKPNPPNKDMAATGGSVRGREQWLV